MEGPVFFVSYSRKNGGEGLDRFVSRLEKAVQQHVSVDGPVIFFDKQDIEPGADWPEALENALGTARAFVAVYAPAYFESEYCGKEWSAFASRCALPTRRYKIDWRISTRASERITKRS